MSQNELTAKIRDINAHLERIGSNFRTKDGLTVIAYFGHLLFLKKTFSTTEDLCNYVFSIKEGQQ